MYATIFYATFLECYNCYGWKAEYFEIKLQNGLYIGALVWKPPPQKNIGRFQIDDIQLALWLVQRLPGTSISLVTRLTSGHDDYLGNTALNIETPLSTWKHGF